MNHRSPKDSYDGDIQFVDFRTVRVRGAKKVLMGAVVFETPARDFLVKVTRKKNGEDGWPMLKCDWPREAGEKAHRCDVVEILFAHVRVSLDADPKTRAIRIYYMRPRQGEV